MEFVNYKEYIRTTLQYSLPSIHSVGAKFRKEITLVSTDDIVKYLGPKC